MDLAVYQDLAETVDITSSTNNGLEPKWLSYVLGIGGETGELIEKIKKLFRDDDGMMSEQRRNTIMAEMGDCLWYHARLASALGFSLNEVVERSMQKYISRQARGKVHGDGDNR